MTRSFFYILKLFLLILFLHVSMSELAFGESLSSDGLFHTDVEIFSTSNRAFTNSTDASLTCYIDKSAEQISDVYKLGDVAKAEMQNSNMAVDSTSQLQKATVTNKLSTQISKQYNKQLEMAGEAFYCVYEAKALGVEKLPAIVFDKKYVVYGETNVALALQQYKLSKDSKRYARS